MVTEFMVTKYHLRMQTMIRSRDRQPFANCVPT